MNSWPADYWRRIGWGEFWASAREVIEENRAMDPAPDSPSGGLVAHEDRIERLTGLRSPLSMN